MIVAILSPTASTSLVHIWSGGHKFWYACGIYLVIIARLFKTQFATDKITLWEAGWPMSTAHLQTTALQ